MKREPTVAGCAKPGSSRYYQRGQSTVGYAIATSIMVLSLFVPWGGNPAAIVQFMDGVRELYQNVTFVLSLP
jgi:hypothetical protein